MGLLEHIFGESEQPAADWQVLKTEQQFDEVLLRSGERPQIIFKHSTQCGISASAWRSLMALEQDETGDADLVMINVIADRPVSRYVTEKTGIRHESPQLLIVKEGEVVWSGSHYAVTKANVLERLDPKSD